MFCHDFIRYFEEQNAGQSWDIVEKRIFKMLRELFDAAVSGQPPSHLAQNAQSRAMYAVDLMLEWTDDVLGNIFSYCRRSNLNSDLQYKQNCISLQEASRVDSWIGEHVVGRNAMVVKMASMMLVE